MNEASKTIGDEVAQQMRADKLAQQMRADKLGYRDVVCCWRCNTLRPCGEYCANNCDEYQ